MADDIIIFGCSPFINKIKSVIPKLQNKYDTIGINDFPVYYPNVKHWFVFDDGTYNTIKNNYKNQLIHAPNCLAERLKANGIENVEGFKPDSYYCEEMEDSLYFNTFSITCAIHWCIRKGYKNIYLAGVDIDDTHWRHFFDERTHQMAEETLKDGIKAIYRLKQYINIYQLNPANKLNLLKTSIKELLQ